MTIASINSVPEVSIASFNGVSKAAIGSIDGQQFPGDSISLSSGSIHYDIYGIAYGDDWVQVYSSGGWTAAVFEDTYNILNSFTTSGVNGDPLQVSVEPNTIIPDCHSAIIRVTRGTVYEDLVIYQDGTVLTCS
jgi:hypothetical protein